MAVKNFNIKGFNVIAVLRHRFEKGERDLIDSSTIWMDWELGFFFRRFEVVGSRNFNKPKEWKNNTVKEYMFGINLLWVKAWVRISRGAMQLGYSDKKQE